MDGTKKVYITEVETGSPTGRTSKSPKMKKKPKALRSPSPKKNKPTRNGILKKQSSQTQQTMRKSAAHSHFSDESYPDSELSTGGGAVETVRATNDSEKEAREPQEVLRNEGEVLRNGSMSDSDLSDDGGDDVDSDYDTDLEMNHHKWLCPEKYEHDTTGHIKYTRACQEEGVQPIRFFLRHMQEEELSLKHHGFGPKAMKALATPLESNTTIETVDLEGNWVMAEGTQHLCRVLRDNVYVTQLNLSENQIGNEGAVAVCNLMSVNKHIENINLSGNGIGNATIEHFYGVLTQPGSALRHLNLRHNQFDDTSAPRFKDVLVENESLESLDLSWNHFQSKGCVMLAEGLKENVGLKELAVAMNGFGSEGGKALGRALQANRTLYKLTTSYCRLPVDCTPEVALGLMHNDKLGILDLSYNCLDADSALVVLSAVQKNDSSELLFLDFGNTRVSLTFKELQDRLSEERGLVVYHGGINDDYRAEINEIDPMEAFRRDPMTKLKEWLSHAGYRLIDLLRHFDKDQSMSISIKEFKDGIASTRIPLTDEQVRLLVNKLDKDGDGEIDFSELVEGDKTHRKIKREIDRYVMEREEKEREKESQEKQILPQTVQS